MSSTSSSSKSTQTTVQVNSSKPIIIGDISETLSLFECCVCLEYITPPILQCRNSHLFCQTCRQKFTTLKCPKCREELPQKDSRNYSLEQMARSLGLQFPCKNKIYGCDVTSLLTEKLNHEELCECQLYYCPSLYGGCRWSGSGEQVAQHLIAKHKYPKIESGIDYWLLKLDSEKGFDIWRKILSFNDQNFIFIRKFDSKRRYYFKAIVLFIGEQRIADQFKYKIEVFNDSNGTRLLWEEKPISIKKDVKKLMTFEDDEGLNLTESSISRLWNDNNFNVKLTIEDNAKCLEKPCLV